MSPFVPPPPLPEEDLDHIARSTQSLMPLLKGKRIFITGGTGFFGLWVLESLLHLDREAALGLQVSVLVRDPEAFSRRSGHLVRSPSLRLCPGSMEDFANPKGPFDLALAMATHTGKPGHPGPLITANRLGTERFLKFVEASGVSRFLFTSSGAAYGAQPAALPRIPESYMETADQLRGVRTPYGESKRDSERLMAEACRPGACEGVIARCFAFVGPGLPLDAQFAAGNFLRDAMRGGPIRVGGDGMPRRSYLYAADLAIWLFTLLLKGACGEAYNVGSADDLTILDLARKAATLVGSGCPVEVARLPDSARNDPSYVPEVQKALTKLGLAPSIGLNEALLRTAAWHRNKI